VRERGKTQIITEIIINLSGIALTVSSLIMMVVVFVFKVDCNCCDGVFKFLFIGTPT
jgi:hypothetical protein